MSAAASHDRNSLIARLTGPVGPELSCDDCFEALDRYVELELAGSDADAATPGMRAHLDGCSACAEDRESLRTLLVSEGGSSDGRPDGARLDRELGSLAGHTEREVKGCPQTGGKTTGERDA